MSFKRRAPKGNLRSKTARNEIEEEEEDRVPLDVVAEIKLDQANRRRNPGVVVDSDQLYPVANAK